MNFENVKKYLDLRKYISFNILALIGLSVGIIYFIIDFVDVIAGHPNYSLLIFMSIVSLPVILISFIAGIFEFIYKKLKNSEKENQAKCEEENKKPKTPLFYILELIYSLLFTLGLIPVVCFFILCVAALFTGFYS